MATFLLHVESRIASLLGKGFYTIGPCGEELMGCVGLALRETDPMALHYRHVAASIARHLNCGTKTMDEILLDRARGYTCSSKDPVTGGAHCAIGGGPYDFVVTSTLASQAPPAVGRALGAQLAAQLGVSDAPFRKDAVSYVSMGDGSVNNAHFLSALNLAEYAQHRGFKAPVLFGITDNGVSISLKGYGWLRTFLRDRVGAELFLASGDDVVSAYNTSVDAVSYVRRKRKPAVIAFENVPRRFGHAATDRQNAYLSSSEIDEAASSDPLARLCGRAVAEGVLSESALKERFEAMRDSVERAFDMASEEPKITCRDSIVSRVEAPLARAPSVHTSSSTSDETSPPSGKPEVMRKHMTRYLHDVMNTTDDVVYLGEDVRHGGYYLVTDGLFERHPHRIHDFPPDETTLMGAGIGYAQAGLTPIVEIPYAKYLDCGADMFREAVISHWLSNGSQPNGMVVRLQGFGRGIFGGNFHTHNDLNLMPGLDVVCFSNGRDWVRGMRHALRQARAGRVVMVVDSTNLLNLRHVNEATRDGRWVTTYPEDRSDEMHFDEIRTYGAETKHDVTVVTYGNGVIAALQAADGLKETHGVDVRVIDSPYVGRVPSELRDALTGDNGGPVVFADECKTTAMPLATTACALHRDGVLDRWTCVGAQPTYNPLGSYLTFLSADDVSEACVGVL